MKALGIVALSFLAIITSLLFLGSSTCVVSTYVPIGLRILGALFACLFLSGTIGLVKKIGRINRDE